MLKKCIINVASLLACLSLLLKYMKVGDKVEFDPEHELGFWDYDPERDPRGKILEVISIHDGVATTFCLIDGKEHWHTAEQRLFIKLEENKAITQGATK